MLPVACPGQKSCFAIDVNNDIPTQLSIHRSPSVSDLGEPVILAPGGDGATKSRIEVQGSRRTDGDFSSFRSPPMVPVTIPSPMADHGKTIVPTLAQNVDIPTSDRCHINGSCVTDFRIIT